MEIGQLEDLLQEELAVVIIRLPIRRHRHHPVQVVVGVVEDTTSKTLEDPDTIMDLHRRPHHQHPVEIIILTDHQALQAVLKHHHRPRPHQDPL